MSADLEELWRTRLEQLAQAWERPQPARGVALERAVASVVDVGDIGEVWVVLYALSGAIPHEDHVLEAVRGAQLVGGRALLEALTDLTTSDSALRPVSFARDQVLVDVGHTAQADFRTGIQRVAVETTRRWHERHPCVLVGWTEDDDALRVLVQDEVDAVLGRGSARRRDTGEASGAEPVVVPLSGTYVSPELALGRDRFSSLARFAAVRTGVVGFDCVCLTSAETVAPGMAAAFGRYLSALRYVDRVATISRAAAAEFAAWARMLAATGLRGPEVVAVSLAEELDVAPDLELARRYFAVGTLPSVLVVGTHEPRKNHLAVLAAAETLWLEGLEFSLSFVGGRTWGAGHFASTLSRLQRAGHPVATVSGVPDEALAGGYAGARFTVFPSLNEGFGLPVAESLAQGTPVITSDFGSMKEIAEGGGALLVDPRDDDDLAGAMRRLLTDDALLADLRRDALRRSPRSWDSYADEVWSTLVEQDALP